MYKLKHPTSKLDWREHAYKENVFVKGGIATCKEATTFNYLRNLGFIPIEEDEPTPEEKPKELEDKIVEVIEEEPKQGLTLSEIASKLEMHYVRLARPIKKLIELGKVRKDDKSYFPKES